MSLLGKTWKLRHERQPKESLWQGLLAARALENPGAFFAQPQLEDLHDPFLFKDMQKAVHRLQKAIAQQERIVIYGDYDVDGTSGAALLIHTLKELGAQVSYRIPHRMKDGYGLHAHYVEELAQQNVKILITVDCGISCADQVELAQGLGMDVIITDHHSIPKQLPPAFALLHPQLEPNYPFHFLSGSGVAFKLASALWIAAGQPEKIMEFVDLASLGTVADCVPLHGENRLIVQLGLKQMERTRWDGLAALLQVSGAPEGGPYTSDTIGFQIGPRINASGRMDDAYWSLQTLLAEGQEATEKSKKLEAFNQERRTLTESILQEAEAGLNLDEPLLFASGKNWPSGLVGLIAGRLQEKYGKPAFVMEDRGEVLVGSARSLPGFHAVEALNQVAHLLNHYGGHEQAAGFHLSKENLLAFRQALMAHAQAHFDQKPLEQERWADMELQPQDVQVEVLELLQAFAPFGVSNPRPLFIMNGVEVLSLRPVGAEGHHLKGRFLFQGLEVDGIAFRFGEHHDALRSASKLVVQLDIHEWQGTKKVQIQLVDAE